MQSTTASVERAIVRVVQGYDGRCVKVETLGRPSAEERTPAMWSLVCVAGAGVGELT